MSQPHAVSIFFFMSGTMTDWYPEYTFARAPMSQAPCTLFWPRSAQMPVPGLPRLPVSIWRLATDLTLSTPVVCWVIPIEYRIADWPDLQNHSAAVMMSFAGIPVIFATFSGL